MFLVQQRLLSLSKWTYNMYIQMLMKKVFWLLCKHHWASSMIIFDIVVYNNSIYIIFCCSFFCLSVKQENLLFSKGFAESLFSLFYIYFFNSFCTFVKNKWLKYNHIFSFRGNLLKDFFKLYMCCSLDI